MKLLRFVVLALVALSGLPTRAAAPFEYMPVLTNLINLPIATNIPPGFLPANRVTAFLGGITTTNEKPYSGFYIFMADSVKATNSPTIGGTNVFRSIYWDTKTSQTSTGRWEQVSWDIALADVITAGGPIGSPTTTAVITYDAKGRLINVSSATIAYPGSFSGFANPSAVVGATAVNGVATTAMRSDSAPAINPVLVVGTSVTSPSIVGTTSVTTPSLVNPSGAIGITPAAGTSVTVTTSGAGILYATGSFTVDGLSKQAGIQVTGSNVAPGGTGGPGAEILYDSGLVTYQGFNRTTGLFLPVDIEGTKIYLNSGTGGTVGIGTTGALAKLAVNGGVHIGADSDPGDNNLTVDGLTFSTTLTVSSGTTLSNADINTATVFGPTKNLISSVTTLAELAYVSGVTSAIQTQFAGKVFTPLYGTVDPNAGTPVVATGDGQLYYNTATGEKWHWYLSGNFWTP